MNRIRKYLFNLQHRRCILNRYNFILCYNKFQLHSVLFIDKHSILFCIAFAICLYHILFCHIKDMYEVPNLCMDDLIAMLSIAKIVYDETKEVPETLIDSDSFPEIYYEALYNVGEEIGVGENGYDEYVTKYCFPDMLEYYELCKEYGRKQKVAFKRNPFVIEAEKFVNTEMNGICSYCIDWRLFAPQTIEKKKYPCLMVTVTPDFYQPVQLVVSVNETEVSSEKSNSTLGFPALSTE